MIQSSMNTEVIAREIASQSRTESARSNRPKPSLRSRRTAYATAMQSADSPVIEVRAATKRYKLGKENLVHALRGSSLTIDRGEMVAIVGPSGSGKSTLMHLIGCLDTPDSGEILVNGRRVDALRGKALTDVRGREIGFIFQGFNLVPTMSAIDNVALAAEYAGASHREARARALELLELVGLGSRAGHLPSELSGGQQQRVAIARALINKPAIILGDEPTGDLDTATSDEIIAQMRRVNRDTGTTFVLVTHNPEVAEACDRTVRMRDGEVEDAGVCCAQAVAPEHHAATHSARLVTAPASV
jgi:putative ABC transport system ATP-binding protein